MYITLTAMPTEIGVVGLDVGELDQIVSFVLGVQNGLLLVSLNNQSLRSAGVVQANLTGSHQDAGSILEAHVLLADGRVLGAVVVVLSVSIVTPYNSGSVDCVVDQLSSVLTRARTGEGSGNILEQAVLVSQSVGPGSPVDTNQTCLLSVVAEGYEQHLSSFLSSYGLIRCKRGCRLTSDDAQGLAVLDVAASSGP